MATPGNNLLSLCLCKGVTVHHGQESHSTNTVGNSMMEMVKKGDKTLQKAQRIWVPYLGSPVVNALGCVKQEIPAVLSPGVHILTAILILNHRLPNSPSLAQCNKQSHFKNPHTLGDLLLESLWLRFSKKKWIKRAVAGQEGTAVSAATGQGTSTGQGMRAAGDRAVGPMQPQPLERNPCCQVCSARAVTTSTKSPREGSSRAGRTSLAPGHVQDCSCHLKAQVPRGSQWTPARGKTLLEGCGWGHSSTGDTSPVPQAGLTTAQVPGGLGCGRSCHRDVGAWRKARRESCVPGRVLLAPCGFAPRFRLEACGRDTLGPSQTPETLQGSPLRQGGYLVLGTYKGKATQTQPCPRLGMVHGLTPKPMGLQHCTPGPTATWGSSWGCAPSSDAHLAMVAILPMLFLTCFQHLKEAQESPELKCSRVLEPGQHTEFGGMPEATGRWREGRIRPRSPRYLLHGCGHG